LMMVAGMALWFGTNAGSELVRWCENLEKDLLQIDLKDWAQLTIEESSLMQKNLCVACQAPANYSICVLTDTTERGPTFSMTPFEHQHESNDQPALNYMVVESAKSADDAFIKRSEEHTSELQSRENLVC